MSFERTTGTQSARVIVVGNEKGGSGKSTVAMHVAVALIKAGHRVASLDLDVRQRTFTRYIENRRIWAQRVDRDLGIPNHFSFDETISDEDEAALERTLASGVNELAQSCGFIVMDTPGHNNYLMRLAHSMADTLITPINDSFVDFDVIGAVDPETFAVTGDSHYSKMVVEARRQRESAGLATDWVVLRNRLSMLASRNKRFVGAALQELSQRLDFRCVEGLAERVVFREFFPRGLTAVDDLDAATLGTRPTMSHATARMEMENLLAALRLDVSLADEETMGPKRDAA
ncbi:MAG: division plane positioning ATPase MipZ [Pseudolabrys sp.]